MIAYPPTIRAHRSVIGLLLLALVTQSFMPLQTHTRYSQTSTGEAVLICTLHGTREIYIDHLGHQQTHPSAAWVFSELLSDKIATGFELHITSHFLYSVSVTNSVLRQLDLVSLKQPTIRGPPLKSQLV